MGQETWLANPALIFLLIIWTLPWKGYALWLAAGKKQKIWFVSLLVFNTLAILEILYIFIFSRRSSPYIAEKKNNETSA